MYYIVQLLIQVAEHYHVRVCHAASVRLLFHRHATVYFVSFFLNNFKFQTAIDESKGLRKTRGCDYDETAIQDILGLSYSIGTKWRHAAILRVENLIGIHVLSSI